jgi:Tol biopolymer transport system component
VQRVLAFAFLMTAGALPTAGQGATGKQANRLIRNGVIVFSRDAPGGQEMSNLYAISPRGGAARLLIGGDVVDCCASWSPDGSKFAFDRYRGPQDNLVHKVVVANADGSNVHEIADGGSPVWSPAGDEIAFDSPSSNLGRIYVIHPDGSGQRLLSSPRLEAYGPAWSPSGRQLAFTGRRTPLANFFVYVVGEDGSGQRRLSRLAAGAGPTWSPNGKLIAFGGGNDRSTKLFLVSADGRRARTLVTRRTASLGSIGSIGWSRNGKRIVFDGAIGTDTHAPFAVYIVRSSGLGIRRVRRLASGPVWSPDGRALVFSAFIRRRYAFEIVNAQGRFLRWIDNSTTTDYYLSWQPRP